MANFSDNKSDMLTATEKYLKDAAIFEIELEKNPKDARSQFYLAQSYKDGNEPEKALVAYRKRIELGGWVEEVYYSYLMIGQQLRALGRPYAEWASVYMEAYNCLPTRMEALYYIVNHNRLSQKYFLGHMFGKMGAWIERPASALFLMSNIYDYLMYDTYSICAYWAKDYKDSAYFCKKLLDEKKMPAVYIPRVVQNLNFSLTKLGVAPEVVLKLDNKDVQDMKPEMNAMEILFFKQFLAGCQNYFEYGSGGSTCLAANLNSIASISSVESSADWIDKLANQDCIKERLEEGSITIKYVDINANPTNWGYPKDDSLKDNWPIYYNAILEADPKPDLILVDGRFRVSCALNCYKVMDDSTIMLIHDYKQRPTYHVIEEFFHKIDSVDTLYAFKKKPGVGDNTTRLEEMLKSHVEAKM